MPRLKHFYKTKRQISYRGFKITVFPDVFVPRQISRVIGVSPKNLRMYRNKNVLDMGSGSGIQSIIAHTSGATSVLAVDINSKACENSSHNFLDYKIKNADFRESDLFENVPEKFDSIVAYLPSIDAPVHGMRDRAVYDPGFQTFRRFLMEAKAHLRDNGIIYACWVNIDGSIATFYAMIEEYGYIILDSRMIIHEEEEWWMIDLQ